MKLFDAILAWLGVAKPEVITFHPTRALSNEELTFIVAIFIGNRWTSRKTYDSLSPALQSQFKVSDDS